MVCRAVVLNMLQLHWRMQARRQAAHAHCQDAAAECDSCPPLVATCLHAYLKASPPPRHAPPCIQALPPPGASPLAALGAIAMVTAAAYSSASGATAALSALSAPFGLAAGIAAFLAGFALHGAVRGYGQK